MDSKELLKHLKQPKLLFDIATGSLTVLGIFGSFSDSQLIRQLSIGVVIGGSISLSSSAIMTELYAQTAANCLDANHKHRQSKLNELDNELKSWRLKHSQSVQSAEQLEAQVHQLQQEMIQQQQAKGTLEILVGELNSKAKILLDEKNQAVARINLLQAEFICSAKITLNQAISSWKSSLLDAIEGSLTKRSDVQLQLKKLKQDLRNCHKRSRNSTVLSAKKLKDKQRDSWALQLFN